MLDSNIFNPDPCFTVVLMSQRARDVTISALQKMERVEEMITEKKQEDTSSKSINLCNSKYL